MLARGELKPGDRLLPERELAHQLGVSRTSLREALSHLEARGVIISHRGAGTWVSRDLTPLISQPLAQLVQAYPRAILDVLELRRVLEELAAERAAQNHEAPDCEQLAQHFEALMVASRQEDLAAETAADVTFHLAIANASKSGPLIHVIHSLFSVIHDSIGKNLQRLHRKSDSRAQLESQHRALFEAIRQQQPSAAKQAAHDHLQFVMASFAFELNAAP